MVVSTPSRKLTYEDFVSFPEDGRRHEILDGEHIVTPAPYLRHQRVTGRLFVFFSNFLEDRNLGEVFQPPTDVLLSRIDVVEPDLVFVGRERLAILTEANIQGSPDLAVEVLSPGSRRTDLGKKRSRYEDLGVGEYWILDPDRDTATVLRRAGPGRAHFEPPLELKAAAGEVLTTPLLPGLEISLRKLFAR